jgi:hypothetical protein
VIIAAAAQPPGHVSSNPPDAVPSQNEPHGSPPRHPQLGDTPQLDGSGLHSNESGSPPMSETPR